METYLFVNPFSGHYCRNRISAAVARLGSAGITVTVCSVDQPDIFSRINAASTPSRVIVAAGDGTINTVVNAVNPGAAVLAVLPLGTSNVLAHELGIQSLDEGVDRIITGRTRHLPVGTLEHGGIRRRFVLMAGIGFDGSVVRDVSLGWKRILKQGAYGLSAIRNALQWDRELIQVRTADQTVTCHSVIVCNASRYGGNFTLAPECSIFSPGLTALCIQQNSRRGYLRLAFELFTGRLADNSALVQVTGTAFEISGTKPLQIDGDFAGYCPAQVMVLPDFGQIIT